MALDARTKHKFSKWINWCVGQTFKDGCFPVKITLRRLTPEGGSVALGSKPFQKDDADMWDCTPISEPDLAYSFLEMLLETVLEDASAWDMPNKYILELQYEFGEPIQSPALAVRGENRNPGAIQGTEPPTDAGVRHMLMRHAEQAMQVNLAYSQFLAQALEKITARQDQYEERRMQMFLALEEAETKRHERELERKKAEQEDARKERMLQAAIPMIPVVANKLLGKPALQEKHNPKVEAIRAAFREMSQDDINRLMSALPPEKFLVLASLFDEVMQDDEPTESTPAPKRRGNGRPSA